MKEASFQRQNLIEVLLIPNDKTTTTITTECKSMSVFHLYLEFVDVEVVLVQL